jgi:hypothetical protein
MMKDDFFVRMRVDEFVVEFAVEFFGYFDGFFAFRCEDCAEPEDCNALIRGISFCAFLGEALGTDYVRVGKGGRPLREIDVMLDVRSGDVGYGAKGLEMRADFVGEGDGGEDGEVAGLKSY